MNMIINVIKNVPDGTFENNNVCQIIPKKKESNFNCSAEELFIKNSCGDEIKNTKNKDQLISSIQDDIINHRIDALLDNITQTKKDLLIQEEDTLYQITTTENQKNNEYKNYSTLNLGDCEDRLKEIYNIDKNLSLIIFKIDYYSPGLLIPIIGYEIFDPVNKSKLDLNYCKDILVELNIPVSIDEENIDKHDPNSEYYTDDCVPSKSENGTDMILNDRQNEYITNNYSLCQNNCTFSGYETGTKKALCNCEVKTKINLISEIIDDKNKLSSNFSSNEGSSSNLNTMKCSDTLFSKEGLLYNIGSYILILIFVYFAISSILFYKVGYTLIENDIQSILFEKKKMDKKDKKNKIKENSNNKNDKKGKMIKTNKNKKSYFKIKYPPKKKNQATTEKKSSNKKKEHNSKSKLELKNVKIYLKFKNKDDKNQKTSKNYITINNEKHFTDNPKKKLKASEYNNFTEYELNTFNYKEALVYDKRTFIKYYISLIKTKHPIIFSFIPIKDYNIMIIKVCLFFLSFCIYYAINTLFFNQSTIHQIYEDGGSYNLAYFLPQILYSFIIAHILSSIIKFVFLSERNIIEIKKQNLFESAKSKVRKVKRKIVIKYIIFFVAGIAFIVLFWYYLSSFGAVYRNSQVYLIKNTFISFLAGLLYPFIINILPGILRIISLNKKKKIMFKISKFFQYL